MHVAQRVASCEPFDAAQQVIVAWMMATGARAFGRLPTVTETTALVSLIAGVDDCGGAAVVRWERALRVAGRQSDCARVVMELLVP